jgi:bifunctional oligoribonuclease and PAP phosphatase NrnA
MISLHLKLNGDLNRFDPILCSRINEWLLTDVKRAVIIPHINPDGDALGSALGLNRVLLNAGIESVVISPGDYPAYLNWLGKSAKALIYESDKAISEKLIDQADVLFFLDFNDIKRIGKLADYIGKISKPIVLIDHHPDPEIKADYSFSDIEVSSTAELVYDFLEETGLITYLDKESSEALLSGIMADTGSFSHNAARPGMYRIAGKLIEMGADKERINTYLFNNFSEKRMRLLGHCLSQKMETFPENHTALIWLSKEELKEFDFHPGDTEGFVNYPLSIKGIVFSVFFTEMNDLIKISFRSKGNFATNEFSSKYFNGGGHRNASGGEIKVSMAEALNLFRQVLPLYSEQLNKESLNLI